MCGVVLWCIVLLYIIMVNKLIEICTGGGGGGKADLINDRLSQLPDDILLLIMSSFSLKEAAVTSLVSHKWNKRIWKTFRLLNFEDSRAMARIQDDGKLIGQERSTFVGGVNNVVEGHEGETIDEFRVSFDLDISCQSHVNKWVGFALDKYVKKLNLDLVRSGSVRSTCCSLLLECCLSLEQSHNLSGFKHPLTSLCLKNVNITAQVVHCFLRSCPHLENLSIENAPSLDIIRVSGVSLPLKHLLVYSCGNMRVIDISAPKLLSFRYRSSKLEELHIRDAPSRLNELHIRDGSSLQQVLFECGVATFSANLKSFSNYFSQLEYLSLTIYSSPELPLGVDRFHALSSLKHLELTVSGRVDDSVLGWIPLIESSPILEKLSLKMACRCFAMARWKHVTDKCGGRPLKSLKTLDIRNLFGSLLELNLINYVVENAIKLEEVIVHMSDLKRHEDLRQALVRAMRQRVEDSSPSGAKFIYSGWGYQKFNELIC